MAESIVKDFKGKLDWVYVGKSEAPKPKETKADIIFNEYMRKVLDVAAPVGIIELSEASDVQSTIVAETIGLMGDHPPQDKKQFAQKWLELEKKYSAPGQENRLGKLVTSAVFMAGSFGLNLGSEVIAKYALENTDKILGLSLAPKTGNKKMIEAGWQYITDYGIEKASDSSAKWLANREDVGFISPLSRTIGKIGNTIMNVTGLLGEHGWGAMLGKSALNPGFIEGVFRFAGAIPGAGFIKEAYGKANSQIMKGEGIIPLGADLAFNMMFAKVSGQMEGKMGEDVSVKPNRAMLADDMPKKKIVFE